MMSGALGASVPHRPHDRRPRGAHGLRAAPCRRRRL
ncbi:hypothetical protein SETIT_7G094500v2 [Setaria italica]|uniref:Uncharacterized protein n=2 Tax=Setaria TaxID=4554 RepID=A0A368RTS8_SETIT|nr:hypothetical protein SETIT_7G094500v2 [Setaria italica]TKW04335.1 hypothetical protein SEVIR_7G102300v2 [Setaria viridis]